MADAKFCQQCGSPLEKGALFCIICGCPVEKHPQESLQENKSKQPGKSRLPLVILLIIVLAAAGLAYRYYSPLNIFTQPLAGGPLSISSLPENSDFIVQAGDISQPEYFLPAANLRLTFITEDYPGDTTTVYKVTAPIATNPWISEADIFIDGDNQSYGGVTHYLSLNDGVFSLFEEQPDQIYMLLPRNTKKGVEWVYTFPEGEVVWTIKDTNAECQTGYGVLSNCLVVEQNNKVFNTTLWYYFAPGLGRVQEQSINEGRIVLDLSAVEQLTADEAFNIVQSFSQQ